MALAERKATLYVDVARAYTQWGRYAEGLAALRTAHRIAPEEVRYRPAVQRIAADLTLLTKGSIRSAAIEFAEDTGVLR